MQPDQTASMVEWARAQLDADEATALGCPQRSWLVVTDGSVSYLAGIGGHPVADSVDPSAIGPEDAAHIIRNDPASALARVAAHRAILDLHQPTTDPALRALYGVLCSHCSVPRVSVYREWPCPTVRHIASVYADESGYDPEWRPE